jgi:hypothetical protein
MLYGRVPLEQALAAMREMGSAPVRKSPTSSPAQSAASPTRRAEPAVLPKGSA